MSWFRKKEKAPKPEAPAAAPVTPAPPSTAEVVLDELRSTVARLSEGKLGVEAINPNGHLFDQGYLDSFKSAELLLFVEQRFGVSVPEVMLVGRLSTLAALAAHVQQQRPAA